MKNFIYKYLLLIISLFLIVSCNLNNEPIVRKEYSVLANFNLNSNYQKVYVYQSFNIDEATTQDFDKGNNDYFYNYAELEIRTENNNFYSFILNKDTTKTRALWDTTKATWYISKLEYYYKNVVPFEVNPQNKYELIIRIDNLTIEGSTIVPGNFQIQSPLNNQIFHYNNDIDSNVVIPINWTKSLSAAGYIVNVKYDKESHDSFVHGFSYTLSDKDTNYNYIQNFWNSTYQKGTFMIEVIAFDKNYYDHVIKSFPYAGLEGAYGYFGSSVLKSVTIKIE